MVSSSMSSNRPFVSYGALFFFFGVSTGLSSFGAGFFPVAFENGGLELTRETTAFPFLATVPSLDVDIIVPRLRSETTVFGFSISVLCRIFRDESIGTSSTSLRFSEAEGAVCGTEKMGVVLDPRLAEIAAFARTFLDSGNSPSDADAALSLSLDFTNFAVFAIATGLDGREKLLDDTFVGGFSPLCHVISQSSAFY